MKSYVYVYRVPALSVLAPEEREKIVAVSGQIEDRRVLHANSQISGRFAECADLIVLVEDDLYRTLKSDGSLTFDELTNVLDFGQSLKTLH
jgi:hypothetical protein